MKKVLVDLQEYVSELSKEYGTKEAYRYIVDGEVRSKTFLEFEKDINFDERYYTENEVDIKLLEITTKYTNLETKYNNLVAVLNKVLGVDFSEDFNSDFARDIRL